MKNSFAIDKKRCCLLMISLAASLIANVLMLAFLIGDQMSNRRDFKIMRGVAEESSVKRIESRIGPPDCIFISIEEAKAFWPDAGCLKIERCAYQYSSPTMRCLVCVDKNGCVSKLLCR